jgi:hypothetical protein
VCIVYNPNQTNPAMRNTTNNKSKMRLLSQLLLQETTKNKTVRSSKSKRQKEANWKRKAGTVRGGSDMNNINTGTFNGRRV